MRVSELIALLSRLQSEHGDVPVYVADLTGCGLKGENAVREYTGAVTAAFYTQPMSRFREQNIRNLYHAPGIVIQD